MSSQAKVSFFTNFMSIVMTLTGGIVTLCFDSSKLVFFENVLLRNGHNQSCFNLCSDEGHIRVTLIK